ncbi:MAG TPA: hypothetical protein VGV59_03700 [Pyrinomonadaceae bacterium]|nr:hypothetical protein [Pyrinomonadaceae bacterium]
MTKTRRTLLRRTLLVSAALIALVAAWVLYDLYAPRRTAMRSFDAEQVARLETEMWRSYYARERLKLFRQLSELLRTQYRLPLWRSNSVAYQAAKAAFVFKDGRSRADYEKALPNLVSFYESIREVSDVEFDAARAARLELEWWIIHRERRRHAPGDLERALAELPAELYDVPAEKLSEHARLRAEAMKIRDERAEAGGVSEADWRRIDELLHASWRSLHTAVNE